MFAVLEFSDFLWIWVLVSLTVAFYSGGRATNARFQRSDAARLHRLEAKIDQILKHLVLEYEESAIAEELSEEVQGLADDNASKIEAIKLHREQTGLGLKEAKDEIEDYIAGRDLSSPFPAKPLPRPELSFSIAAVLGLLGLIVAGVTVVLAVLLGLE